MVKGLDLFRQHFADHADQYVLIGGTAATLAMEDAGLDFRATKDLDIVLHIEALNAEFGTSFWAFVERGHYTCRLSEELHLSQLRKARGLTQEAMAELLGVSQAEVSKMERRSELYIGTLKKFIEAMDGELVLAARFADGVEVPITLAETEGAA